MIKRTLGLVVVCGGLMAGGAVQAHHSISGIFSVRRTGHLTGTVTKVFITNPHGELWMDARDKSGSIKKWIFQTGSATTLARLGLFVKSGPNHVGVGDTITVTYYPTRDKRPLGFLKTIKMPDGHVIVVAKGDRP